MFWFRWQLRDYEGTIEMHGPQFFSRTPRDILAQFFYIKKMSYYGHDCSILKPWSGPVHDLIGVVSISSPEILKLFSSNIDALIFGVMTPYTSLTQSWELRKRYAHKIRFWIQDKWVNIVTMETFMLSQYTISNTSFLRVRAYYKRDKIYTYLWWKEKWGSYFGGGHSPIFWGGELKKKRGKKIISLPLSHDSSVNWLYSALKTKGSPSQPEVMFPYWQPIPH